MFIGVNIQQCIYPVFVGFRSYWFFVFVFRGKGAVVRRTVSSMDTTRGPGMQRRTAQPAHILGPAVCALPFSLGSPGTGHSGLGLCRD